MLDIIDGIRLSLLGYEKGKQSNHFGGSFFKSLDAC